MVQIGNLHIGKADNAEHPNIDIVEAAILTQHLYYRYLCIEQTQQYYKAAKDTDFKKMVELGLKFLENEVTAIESQMEKYKVPMPSRSPKSIKAPVNVNDSSLINDQFMFEQIRNNCAAAVEKNVRNAIAILHNDALRGMFINFATEELQVMLKCCKYGKLKDWLPVYPTYKPD